MQTASFIGAIETLLYIIAFYYIFKFLAKLFLPLLVKKVVQKASENYQQNYNTQNQSYANNEKPFGNSKTEKPRETKKVGEYVDYEEID